MKKVLVVLQGISWVMFSSFDVYASETNSTYIRPFQYAQDAEAVLSIIYTDMDRITPLPGDALPSEQKKKELKESLRKVLKVEGHMTPEKVFKAVPETDRWVVACNGSNVIGVANYFLVDKLRDGYIETISLQEAMKLFTVCL